MSVSWNGKRILLVEDDLIVALALMEHLKDAGAEVIGPVTDVPKALQRASHDRLCGAILDVNLGKLDVWPVARMLAARGIPFVFATACCQAKLQAASFGDVPRLSKPYREADVAQALLSLIARTSEGSALDQIVPATLPAFPGLPSVSPDKS